MKKILLFSVLGIVALFGEVRVASGAGCVVEPCGGKGDDCISAYDLIVDPSNRTQENEVYICEQNHCPNGTIVHNNSLTKFYMCVIASKAGVNFMGMGNDTWERYNVRVCDTPRDGYILSDDPNATKVLRNSTNSTETLVKRDTGSVVLGVGQNICIEYKCNAGYVPSEEKITCVKDDRASNCTNSGGTWNGTACACDSAKKLILAADGKTCQCSPAADYQWDSTKKQCVETDAAIRKREQAEEDARTRRQRDDANRKAKKCTDSHGTWKNGKCVCDAAKNFREQGGVCVCKDADYELKGDKCVLIDIAALKLKCESAPAQASGAYWDLTAKQCLCRNPLYIFIGDKCEANPEVVNCNKVVGARWVNGECQCTDKNKVPDYSVNKCVESEDARQERIEAEANVTITTSRRNIETATKRLNTFKSDIQDELTVWKNADGKFNTTRLASDSIAGVVLGTAGGLITSNVIKKNQVENGFEDINCSVGGQVVAGWGDQFRVGIH